VQSNNAVMASVETVEKPSEHSEMSPSSLKNEPGSQSSSLSSVRMRRVLTAIFAIRFFYSPR
jgi:hypothetical protein